MVDRLLGRSHEDKDAGLDPKAAMWKRVQLARNLARPRTLDLLEEMADEVIELHGDRGFGDDVAMVAQRFFDPDQLTVVSLGPESAE